MKYEYLGYKYNTYYNETLKKWVSALNLGKDLFGKRKRKAIYGATEKEAIKKTNSLIIDMDSGDYIEPTKDTLISFLNEYHKINQTKWEDTTAELYKMYIDVHFEPYFKQMKLADIKPIILDKFYNYKMTEPREYKVTINNKPVTKTADPLSINTVIKLNKFLKSAFNYALKNGLIRSNPTDNVILSKKEKYIPTVYDEEQFLKLYEEVKNTDDEVPIILGAGCGFRRGEIFGLYWRNIGFENKTITIEKTNVRFTKNIEKDPKNETSKRTIVVPDYVIEVLESRMENSGPNDKVITKWKPGSYSERFKNLLKKYNMPHIRLHDLRHYNAVVMMNRGIPDKVAAGRLGHSQVQTLRDVYQHVLKDMDTTAANEINDMFSKNKNSHEPREE